MKAVAVSLLVVIALSQQGCNKESADPFPAIEWGPEDCLISGYGGVSGQVVNWSEARARFSGNSKVFTLQLMNAGTSGSFIMPGKGWLTISLHLDTEENVTIPVTNKTPSSLPADVPLNEATIVYTDAQTNQRFYLEGKLKLGRYSLTRGEGKFEIDANLDGLKLPNNAGSFYGDMSVEGVVLAATSGGGVTGNCSDNGTSCATSSRVLSFKNQCQSSVSQAPCYCAAAATYQCFLDKGCYKEAGANTSTTKQQLITGRDNELAKARQLGTTCF